MVLFVPLLLILLVMLRTVDRTHLVLLLPTLFLVVAGVVVMRIAARDGRAADTRASDRRATDRRATDRRARARDRARDRDRPRNGSVRNGSVTELRPRRNGHRRSP